MTAYRTSPLAVATLAPRAPLWRRARAWWRGTLRKWDLKRAGWCVLCRLDHCCANLHLGAARMLTRRIHGDCRCRGGRAIGPRQLAAIEYVSLQYAQQATLLAEVQSRIAGWRNTQRAGPAAGGHGNGTSGATDR